MSKKIKKYVLPYFPYLIAFWFFSKCGTAYRMAAGANLGEKLFGMVKTIGPVFQSYAPGLGLFDLAVGVAGAVILYFVVQSKIKKARKFRRDMEYGSARWGGRLHFTEEEVTRQAGEPTSGQLGPKPAGGGKFRQDEEREKPSSRLRQDDEARRDTAHEEQDAQKARKDKQEKKKERAEAKAEHSAVKLEAAKEKLAQQKPQKPPGLPQRAATAAGAGVWAYTHRKIHEVEHENVGVESAHKAELLAEAGVHKATRYTKWRIREHPARQVEKWEHKTMKANANLHYQQMAQEHPELQSSFLSRMAQKWKIKREYAKQAREAARQGAKAAGAAATTTEKAAAYAARFVRRHKSGVIIILLLFCLFLILNSIFSALPSLGTGMMNAVVGTSYTAEDEDILGANEDYTALENELRQKIANIERTHPGYDEYRYNVDELGHNPYELTSYLIAKFRTYTRENVQSELRALFEAQYKLTLTEEVEIRYRTETDTWTDEDGTTHTDTYEVPYEYYILHVRLQNKTLPVVVNSLLDAEQKEIYDIMVPRIELNAGTINNNLMQVTVGDEYQITGGISNDLAVTGKDYGKCDRYLYISREAAVGDQAVYFQTDSKTVTPADSSLDIRLGNTSAANVTALTNASNSMGWNAPLATLWVQRDGAAKLTVGGLTLNDLPVYVLSLPVDETGKVLDASEAQVYAARKTNTGDTNPRDIDVTLPDVSGNGYAVAVVQPSQDHGTLVIQGPETIERNKTGEHYPVTYTVTYDMSESMESMIEQSGGEAEYVLTIDRDTRLVGNPGRFIGNPGRFNGESISVTYRLPHSEFRVGDVLLASAMLRITVGEGDYIIPSNVTKTRKVETTYSLTTQVNGGNGTISASKAGLAAGSHETIVFTPDSGYQIDTVTVNGVKAEVRSNMLEVIMDADKTVIVTYKGIPHVHNHGTAWKSDADNHWHECPCGDRKDVAAHSFKWVIDKEPTATRKGSKHEECTVCGYKKAAVVIPAKGSTVKPSDQPDKPGNTASANTGDSSDPVLWSALLFISGGAVIGTTVVSRKKKYNR